MKVSQHFPLSLVFTENEHLEGFSPIMKVSFQHTKREDFSTTLGVHNLLRNDLIHESIKFKG